MDFFYNSWVVGIGGGVISGLVVYFVTRKIISKKENREYLQKVKTANIEIIYAIRPFLVEGNIPKAEVIDSIVIATAKKYEVNEYDLYYYEEVADQLIKEITENSFLSASDKIKYCELASRLNKYAEEQEKQEEQELKEQKRQETAKKSNNSGFFSLTLALIAASFAIISTMTVATYKDGDFLKYATILLVSILLPLVAIIIGLILRIMRKTQRKELSDKKEIFKQKEKSDDKS